MLLCKQLQSKIITQTQLSMYKEQGPARYYPLYYVCCDMFFGLVRWNSNFTMACLGLYVCETMHCFHLREAEEECGGANEEESGCRHRDVARGSEGSAGRDHGVGEGRRGWTPPSTLTAATWHHFQCVVVCVCVVCSTTAMSFRVQCFCGCIEWICSLGVEMMDW